MTFLTSLVNEGSKPLTVGLWQITQTVAPSEVRLPTFRTAAQPRGFAVLVGGLDHSVATVGPNALRIRMHPTQSFRYGSKGGDGTLEADLGKFRLITFSAFSRKFRFAEGDSAKEVTTAAAMTGYAELGHLAPLEALDPRQVQQQTVTWRLTPITGTRMSN